MEHIIHTNLSTRSAPDAKGRAHKISALGLGAPWGEESALLPDLAYLDVKNIVFSFEK